MSAPLPLAVVGVDFRRASSRRREPLLLTADERVRLSAELRRTGVAAGLACLDTCNRSEWIATGAKPEWAAEVLRTQLIVRGEHQKAAPPLKPYVHVGEAAARHIFEVASGLESFVFGEHEIASQFNRALERSRREGTGSAILNGLGTVAGRLTRDTHKICLTGSGPRGVHDLALAYLRNKLPELADRAGELEVIVVGAGQIGEKVTRALRGAGVEPTVCNRTLGVAWLEPRTATPLAQLAKLLEHVDAAVVCSAAPMPLVGAGVGSARSPDRPLYLVDLGIPRQVDPRVGEEPGVECVDLDGLQERAGRRVLASAEDVDRVEARIAQAVAEFTGFCAERDLTLLLQRTQERHKQYVHSEVPELVERELAAVAPADRTRLLTALLGMLRRYTNAVFSDIHELIDARVREAVTDEQAADEDQGGEA